MTTTFGYVRQVDAMSGASEEPLSVRPYCAETPFSTQRPDTLVVYCSDGRWHAQVEEFVREQCSQRADLYAVPGGPAGFNPWGSTLNDARAAEHAIRFLREHHQLESAWLIAHEGCAYYYCKYGPLDSRYILQRQLEDLDRARDTILRWFPDLKVRKVFAYLESGRVAFATVPDGTLR
jgi:hypothetical protein